MMVVITEDKAKASHSGASSSIGNSTLQCYRNVPGQDKWVLLGVSFQSTWNYLMDMYIIYIISGVALYLCCHIP